MVALRDQLTTFKLPLLRSTFKWLKRDLNHLFIITYQLQGGSLDQLAWFSTKNPDTAHDDGINGEIASK